MADASNDTVADSGAAGWFPTQPNDSNGWRLDVVTLLAVIGENSMAEHSQAITASALCLLPRILPAPQAFLKPSRPVRMPETHAKMTGVYSGVVLDTVGFFANIIHPLDHYKPFAFKVLRITHKDRNEAGGIVVPPPQRADTGLARFLRRHSSLGPTPEPRSPRIPGPPRDVEDQPEIEEANGVRGTQSTVRWADVESGEPIPGIRRRRTVQEKLTDAIANPTLAQRKKRPAVPPTLFSPVHVLTMASFLLTLAIIATGVYWRDGNAVLSISCVSFASSVVGVASWWKPILMNRSHTNKVPDGDVIIRTREGAFILVKCTEEVARELYSSLEECNYYVGGRIYRLLMGFGTVLLMVSVILLGNCNFNSQVFIGMSYIILNLLYWAMGMLPKRFFWDLSRYVVQDITPQDSKDAHKNTNPEDQREGCKSFTRTLWYAIRETKVTGWVERGGAAPGTPQWKRWLDEAERQARLGNRTWGAVGAKDDIMKQGADPIDTTEQHAPATYVQTTSQNPSY
jgi:hypothetical protein